MAIQRGVYDNDYDAVSVLLHNEVPMHLTDSTRRFPLHFACGLVAVDELAQISTTHSHDNGEWAANSGKASLEGGVLYSRPHTIAAIEGTVLQSLDTQPHTPPAEKQVRVTLTDTTRDIRSDITSCMETHPAVSLDMCTCEAVQRASILLQRSASVVQLMLNRHTTPEDHVAGYNLNSRNIDGNTALHLAVCSGSAHVTQLLLNSGSRCDILNKKGQSPAQYALAQHTAMSDEHAEKRRGDAWPLLAYFITRSIAICDKWEEADTRRSNAQPRISKDSPTMNTPTHHGTVEVDTTDQKAAVLRAQFGFVAHCGNVNSKNVCRAYNQLKGCAREWCKFGHFCATCGVGSNHSKLKCTAS
ncbi:hypothetical protein SARC_09708 [Sphaeroforma arctica JP610]|uniref:Uncharacterized protein n=1 Tax=Sphaeroforma arctica JP610 TaxID=667725 RepID=A0A0L0FM31_9EUKA|nr:hypothetical protein SARC_09708 [Sphaeroforma arctica JP610]KNC77844.1 hypothetical protein SARC_09708 [Sphaeroforma arctica JP610]|eukprot:XP_014151746.1 hypothetical protein SARC_09708 [Sphaeroforma arctica JP610]